MDFNDLQTRALAIQQKYAELNQHNGHRQWTPADYMAGFVGDVGDLSKLIMAKEGLRSKDNVDDKLAHELSDCLWSILVLAKHYEIDLATEFSRTMNQLEEKISADL